MILKINLFLKTFMDENLMLCSLFENLSEEANNLYNQKKNSIYNHLRDVKKIDNLNKKMCTYLNENNLPLELLFVVIPNSCIDENYLCIQEVFSKKIFIVDKLVLKCKINKIIANIELCKYSLEQINAINEFMSKLNSYISYEDYIIKANKCKIIKFPNNRNL